MKKRMLSMLLVLAMVLSILPVSVFAVERDSSREQVRVIVENSVFTPETDPETFTDQFWSGTLVDTWVDLDGDSTMMSCVGDALAENGYTAEGLDAGYITSVNGLDAFDGGGGSGWMGTLNDWFTNEGFPAFTVANGKLAAGDEIRILYSKNMGQDLGSSWGNNDTSLRAVKFSTGDLEPVFAPETLEYTLTVPDDVTELVFTPTAANKNFQVHTVAGETEYKRTAAIPVADGTDITVTVGTGPTMNVGAVPTTYTFHVKAAIQLDPEATAQWPGFQGGGSNNGVTDAPTPRNASDMKVLWSRKLSEGWKNVPSPVILADGAVFTMSGTSLKKMNAQTGLEIASADMVTESSWSSVPPTFGGGFIFCPLQNSTVQAFRASDMKPVWTYQDENKGQSQSPILYDNGKIYVGFGYGSGDHAFVCVDAASGKLLWTDSVPGGFYWAGAAVIGNYVLVGTDQGHVYSWNKNTGELAQDLEVCTGNIRSSICVDGGKVYFTGNKGVLYSLDVNGETGALTNLRSMDFSEFGAATTSTPAVYNGIAYVGGGNWSGAKSVIAIDLENGEVLWHIDEPAYPQNSMLVSTGHPDGYIYIYTTYNGNPGGVNVIKAKADGSEAVQSELFNAAGYENFCICSFAVSSDGTLYYKNDSGTVFALGLTKDAKARQAAEAAIAAIGEVNEESGEAIKAAREAFDALAPEQQKLVCNAEALTAAEKAFAILNPVEASVHLSYAQDDFYLIVPQDVTVSSAASDIYGYTDKVEGAPSALDCAIKIHEIMLAEAFAPETCQEFLVVNETGFITKFMGEDTSDVGFAVNGRLANNGVVDPAYGTCTAYNVNQAPLKASDTVQFFHYNPAGYYGEIYSVFCRGGEHVTEFTMLTGVEETLAVQGYTFIQEGASPEVTWKPMMPDNQVCTLAMDGDEIGTLLPIEGAVTDDEGNFPLVFAEPGTYYLAMVSNPDMWTYFIPEICKVTVVDPTAEQQAALEVKAQIDAIGEVTLEKEDAVKAAREAYNALTPEQQAMVSNLDILIAAEKALAELKAVKANVTVSCETGNFYMVVPQEAEVSSFLSDKYGYVDQVEGAPSVLDSAIRIHEILLGEEFTPENCTEYLAATETGYFTTFLAGDAANVGFSVNGLVPNDGVVNPSYGTYTGYSANQASLDAGDLVQFFYYIPEGGYGDLYAWLTAGDTKIDEFSMLTGVEETFGTQSYAYMYEGCNETLNWKSLGAGHPVCTLTMEGEGAGTLVPVEGTVTDETGSFTLSFDAAGTYYVAVSSNPATSAYVIPRVCKITVTDPTAEQQAALDVKAQIDAIGEVTLEKEDAIRAAREAYDALTEEQQKLVTNLDVLTAAEAVLEALIPHADAEKMYKDTAAYVEALASEAVPTVSSIGGDWMVLGLARDGRQIPDAYYENVLAFVNEKINSKEQLSRNKSTENSRLILALTAMGRDVTDVGGHNLLQGITDLKYLNKQGINGPIWALIAFDSHDYEIPAAPEGAQQVTREALIEVILDDQLEDGGWKISGEKSDPDMTAMALLALAPYCEKYPAVKTAADKALNLLSGLQMKDGSFGSWGVANAESCAQVLTALAAYSIDPLTDARFIKNGRTVVDALGSYFVEGGGFRHLAEGERNGMSTEQGYYALVALRRMQSRKNSLFDMTDVTIKAPYVNPYVDVKDDDWFAGAVQYVTENELMGGTGNQMFEPETAMTRGMLVTVLYRASGSPDVAGLKNPFSDVGNDWYTDAVLWAADKNVVNGMENKRFAPEDPVSREQMVTILFRYAGTYGMASSSRAELDGFADGAQVQDWAQEAMQWAVAEKVIQGSVKNGENCILPADGATRAEVATVLMRFISMFEK